MIPSLFKRPRCSECGWWLKIDERREPIPCRLHPAAKIELVPVCRKCLSKRLDVNEAAVHDDRFAVLHGWYICQKCMEETIAWWRRHGGDYFAERGRQWK